MSKPHCVRRAISMPPELYTYLQCTRDALETESGVRPTFSAVVQQLIKADMEKAKRPRRNNRGR